MGTTKFRPSILFILLLGVIVFLLFFFTNTCSEEKYTIKTSNLERIQEAEKLVRVSTTPTFEYSFDYMTQGVLQHLDRDFTYDVVPEELEGGLLFQGIHRPPKGTVVTLELVTPTTVYFFFHSEIDGGYTRIFENLKDWKKTDPTPKYDIHNGDHGLKMTMFELKAQPGTIVIPATTKDRACFSIVFQFSFGNLAEPDS